MTLNKIRRVVAFLLLGVGIVYIVLFIQAYFSTISEGFQVGTSCEQKIIGGRNTYLCPDENDAYSLVVAGTTDAVCYADSNINYSTTVGSIGFTCYDTKGEPQFDSVRGVYIPFNPITDSDPMPGIGINDYNIGVNSFLSGYNSFSKSYRDTENMRSSVSTLGLVNINLVQNRLQTLSTSYCVAGATRTHINECSAITSALNTTGSIINDDSVNSLFYINSTLTKSASTIKYNFYNNFMQSFYTSPTVFISSPRVAEYIGNK
jgi:hypothetical protein